MNDPVSIGPFDLGPRLGEGGMGAVYRGEHRSTGVPVAIKVLRHETDPDARDRFHREVQAHAGLQHPGVVYLFDYGDINPEAADASGDELRAGDPFVAMELAERGTVREAGSVDTWESVCRLLVQVLDALAYAHARGVVHRDLKPENLLLFGPEDPGGPEWRVKLADFGIAHALQKEREADTAQLEGAVGTPMYMAPEQCRGEWREYGPWTDLYAVGCIAWELVCGRPPFRGDNIVSIVRSHEQEARPPLEPQFPVPEQLESWIHRAMAVDPERRFRRGADAAWALPRGVLAAASEHTESREGSATNGEGVGAANRDDDRRTPTAAETRVETLASTVILSDDPSEQAFAETVAARESEGSDRETNEPEPERIMAHGHPPVPQDWRPAHTEPLPAPLVGAGLGLFGLREPPFVNRTQECQRIWEALRKVVEDQTPRLISVRGEAGTGKSRLVEWMATRAHEVGAMQTLRAVHTKAGGPGEGLRGALEETLRTLKMDRGEVFEHLRETLPPLEAEGDEWRRRDARALTEYLRPTDDEAGEVDGPRYRFSSADQKHGLLVRILRRLSRRRPLLVWLDDLQWGDSSIGVVRELLDRGERPPAVLIAATVRSDILRERPDLADEIETLEASDSATRLPLTPLEADHQRELLQGLLPLEDGLAARLAARTEGHPLFAMQLLAHWIERGLLEADPDGFRVPADRQVELPADIHELWMDRIGRLVEKWPPEARRPTVEALERAAALGRELDADEWHAMCEAFEGVDPDLLRHRLIEAGLAERTERGWTFAHGMLVDSLARRADRQGRWQQHHRRCAELLERLYPDRPNTTAARRADHRIAAGDLEEALEPLLQKASRLEETGEVQRTRRALQRRGEILERLEIPEDDPRSIENDLKLATVEFRAGGDPKSLLDQFDALRARAERAGRTHLTSAAWRQMSYCQQDLGRWEEAAEAAAEASRLASGEASRQALVDPLLPRGWAAYHLGRLDEAREHFRDALTRATDLGDQFNTVEARRGLGWVSMSQGDDRRASELFEETLEAAREAGYRAVEATCVNALAELARFDGDAEQARRRYRLTRDLNLELHRPTGVAISTLNLALAELMAARFSEAAEHLDEADRQLREMSRRDSKAHLLELSRLTHAAGVENWSRFDDLLSRYDNGWPEDGRVVKDHPWLLEMAGDYAAEAGEPERARRVWRLAGELWERLGDEPAASEVEQKLEELDDETPRG